LLGVNKRVRLDEENYIRLRKNIENVGIRVDRVDDRNTEIIGNIRKRG
jgi:hypothetical protein